MYKLMRVCRNQHGIDSAISNLSYAILAARREEDVASASRRVGRQSGTVC